MAETDTAPAEQQPLLGQNGSSAPRSNDVPASAAGEVPSFQRNLGAVEAFAIVISIVIGSGIFTSPGAVDTNVPSPGAALGVWLVGGVLAWTGAATLAELGTAIPGEGGVQPYLQYMFGDVFGFLAAWSWLVAIMPATLAILSIVFVESLSSVTVGAGAGAGAGAGVSTAASGGQSLVHKLLSILVLLIVTLANSVSTRASARLNNFFVATKFIAIGAVVVAALAVVIKTATAPPAALPDWRGRNWFDVRPTLNPDGTTTDWTQLSRWALLGHYSAALYGALWAYSGWDKAVYVSAELREPARQLPLAIHAALPTIVACFLAANAAYYVLLPWNIVSTTDSIAVTAFARLLGPAAGFAAAILVCLVVAGSLLGNSFVSGRMAVAAANKNWIPSVFAVLGTLGLPASASAAVDSASAADSDAPINALVLSATLASVYILFGNFRALLTFNGLGEFTFFFLTVLGAIVLRFREPGLVRPYKPLLAAPIAFLLVSGFVVVRGAAFAPAQALVLVVLWLLGLAFYYRPRSA